MSTEDSPFGRLEWELNQAAFDVHPYKTDPIGWQEDLDATTFEDALNFYKKFYAPNRAKIAVVGDFSVPEVLKVLDKYYGPFSSATFTPPEIHQEPVRHDHRRSVIAMKSESVLLADAVWGMRFDDPSLPAESLVCTLLADSKFGYLSKELVDKGIARKVSADCSGGVDPGLSTLFVVGNPGLPLKKVEGAYDAAMKKFSGFLSENHLDKAKLYYLADQWASLRSPMSLAQQLARSATVDNDPLFEFKFLDRVNKVTLKDALADFNSWKKRAHVRVLIEPSDHTAPMVRTQVRK